MDIYLYIHKLVGYNFIIVATLSRFPSKNIIVNVCDASDNLRTIEGRSSYRYTTVVTVRN